jgi:hypothetical protein
MIRQISISVADQILAVLSAFHVNPDKIGYFTLDNAESNTTAMMAIGNKLGFDSKSRQTLEEFKHLSKTFPDAERFRVRVNLAWEKLDKYYNLLDEIPIYYTALGLHTAYRWD